MDIPLWVKFAGDYFIILFANGCLCNGLRKVGGSNPGRGRRINWKAFSNTSWTSFTRYTMSRKLIILVKKNDQKRRKS